MPDLHDHHAETTLLGGVMLEPTTYPETAELVDASMFHKGSHRTTWEAITRLHATGNTRPDNIAVADDLEAHGHLDAIGGHAALADMVAATATSTTATRDAHRIRELARRRRVVRVADELARLAGDPAVDVDAQLLASVDQLTATTDASRGLVTVRDVEDGIWRLRTEGRQVHAVTTGWRPVDDVWKLARGRLTIVTGWPGHGKSAFLDALAVNVAVQHGWKTAFWSIEQAPFEEHGARLAGIANNHDFETLDYERLDKTLGHLDDHFTWVNHDVHTTVPAILAQVRIAQQRRGIDLAVIDPWTDVDLPRDRGVRQDEAILDGLVKCFRFARSTGIHLVVVVHPKQRDRNADGTLPVATNADLHGGSAYYKVCDFLLSIWRDEQSINRVETEVDIHVQKVRRNGVEGQTGRKVTLVMRPETGVYQPLLRRAV